MFEESGATLTRAGSSRPVSQANHHTSTLNLKSIISKEFWYYCSSEILVRPILGKLHTEGVIPNTVVRDINAVDIPSKRTAILLDYLKQEPREKLEVFCDVLRKSAVEQTYPSHLRIANRLRKELSTEPERCTIDKRKSHSQGFSSTTQVCKVYSSTVTSVKEKETCVTTATKRTCSDSSSGDPGRECTEDVSDGSVLAIVPFVHEDIPCNDFSVGDDSKESKNDENLMSLQKRPRFDDLEGMMYLERTIRHGHRELFKTSPQLDHLHSTHMNTNSESEDDTIHKLIGEATVLLHKDTSCEQKGQCVPWPQRVKNVKPSGILKSSKYEVLMLTMRPIRRKSVTEALCKADDIYKKRNISLDVRMAAILEVIPSSKASIPVLEKALKECDGANNSGILKCRMHHRLVFCHSAYEPKNPQMAKQHALAALELGDTITEDYGPIQSQVYAGLVQKDVMRLPIAYKEEDLDELEKHYRKAVQMMTLVPSWMKGVLLSTILEYALLKMMKATYLAKQTLHCEAKDCIMAGERVLLQADHKYFGTLDKAYNSLIQSFKYKALGEMDMARHYKSEATDFLQRSGRQSMPAFEIDI